MGIDPGLVNTGIAVINWEKGKLKHVYHNLVQPPPKAPLAERLGYLSREVFEESKKFDLHSVGIEGVFHSVNVKSALLLGQARGALIGAVSLAGFSVFEYSALQIKQAVVGYGKAGKEQVKKMVEFQLNADFSKLKYDATDAMACAICLAFAQTSRIR